MTFVMNYKKTFISILLVGIISALSSCNTKQHYQQNSHYQAYVHNLTSNGFLRSDRAARDVPYNNQDILRNFQKIIFENETSQFGRPLDNIRTVSKWTTAIRYRVVAFPSSPSDQAMAADVMGELRQLSGLDIAPAQKGQRSNLTILVMSADQRQTLDQFYPSKQRLQTQLMRDWIGNGVTPCFGWVFHDSRQGSISKAEIFIYRELPQRLKRSCYVEELTQALGLINDHSDIRPSVFNDDAEFMELTHHDQELVKLLYHPAIKAGMNKQQAMPVVEKILGIQNE